MILSLTLALAPLPISPAMAPDDYVTPAITNAVASAPAQDFEADIAAAGEDVEKLSTLAAAWKEAGENDAARAAWRRILELDADHAAAHKGLRHHSYDGKWFETYTALSKYRREEEKIKKEQGLVRFQDEWVDAKEVRYLKLGWVKSGNNAWASPASIAMQAEEAKMVEAGWEMHDLYWVNPDEEPMVASGKFKCGDEWLDAAAADEFHSELNTWWEIPGTYFAIYTTLPRNSDTQEAEWARFWADSTYPDLVRIYGVKPGDVSSLTELRGQAHNMPGVVALRDVAQYNEFAAGSQDPPRQAAEQEGFSSLHYAFFADSFINFVDEETPPVYRGGGVGMWATEDQALKPFGQYSVRHAAAHSYAEAIDPSWDTLGDAFSGEGQLSVANFWQEKRVPRWLRYGAASYVERYMVDTNADNPMWIRAWGMQNLNGNGGVGDLEELFAFGLSLDNIEASTQMIHRSGAVVAFMLDSGDMDVKRAHDAFRAALRSGDDTSESVAALQAALSSKAAEIGSFCEM